jgi:hypothetical protein
MRLSAGAGDQRAASYRRLDPSMDLRGVGHRVDHHQGIVVHLKTMGGGGVAVGEIFVDQEKREGIVAIETETEAAAFFIEIRQQPAFPE